MKDLNRLTRLLKLYLLEFVENKDCKYRILDLKDKKIDRVLSFNYTSTYNKLYDKDNVAEYCYIHGKAQDDSKDTCNMVLGIDEYLPPERRDSDNQFVWFKKFYQRIYKSTDSSYIDWLNTIEWKKAKLNSTEHLNVFIYGHSLDVTDKDVLSKLLLFGNTSTIIFYHDRAALAKQISNLIKVIGEDNLIRMTRGKERTIDFIATQKAIEIDDSQ